MVAEAEAWWPRGAWPRARAWALQVWSLELESWGHEFFGERTWGWVLQTKIWSLGLGLEPGAWGRTKLLRQNSRPSGLAIQTWGSSLKFVDRGPGPGALGKGPGSWSLGLGPRWGPMCQA